MKKRLILPIISIFLGIQTTMIMPGDVSIEDVTKDNLKKLITLTEEIQEYHDKIYDKEKKEINWDYIPENTLKQIANNIISFKKRSHPIEKFNQQRNKAPEKIQKKIDAVTVNNLNLPEAITLFNEQEKALHTTYKQIYATLREEHEKNHPTK